MMVSEKLDGLRAFWDGGLSRGKPSAEVPWANTEKDHRLKEEQIATGLWTRYGKVIHAPAWWLDELPDYPLDGELYSGHFQDVVSFTKKHNPIDSEWRQVKYCVFDSPHQDTIFADGKIDNLHFKKVFSKIALPSSRYRPPVVFENTIKFLRSELADNGIVTVLDQEDLPFSTPKAEARLFEKLDEIVAKGGEGLMLRKRISVWEPCRSHNLLKVKPWQDAEGIVVGYVSGLGKYSGMLGSLVILFRGKEFSLSGFTDEERMITDPDWARKNQDVRFPEEVASLHFPRGSTITFKFRELTRDGIPKEARYFRKSSS